MTSSPTTASPAHTAFKGDKPDCCRGEDAGAAAGWNACATAVADVCGFEPGFCFVDD